MDMGNWQMVVRAIDGSEHVVPIPIRICEVSREARFAVGELTVCRRKA
jgi:hypothetical protein